MLYRKLRDELNNVDPDRVLRLTDMALITRDGAGWEQYLLETEGGTINVEDAYPIPPPGIAELADRALQAINWSQKIIAAQAGQTLINGLTNDIADINAALTLLTVKPALVAYMTKQRNFDQGLLDEAVDTLIRWRKLLQALSKTTDATP